MIKTKVADVFIKDKNFSDNNYLELSPQDGILLDFSEYNELSKYIDFIEKTNYVNELSYNSINLLFSNNAKIIDINNGIDNFVIVENINSRGDLYREGLDNSFSLCLENISINNTFKSYLAVYLKNSLVIAHSNNNNKIELTKITQNDVGVYQKLKFSEINGNYKVISMNKFQDIIYLVLCDNITTYIYKIEDYVITLIKTVTENIVFEDQVVNSMKNDGLNNKNDNVIYLSNSQKSFTYDIITNNYIILDNTTTQFNYFDMISFVNETPDNGDILENNEYVTSKFLYNIGSDIYIKFNINNFLGNTVSTKIYNFPDYLSDGLLLNININTQLFIYKATDNKTKVYVMNDIFFNLDASFVFLNELNINIKKVSYNRYFDSFYLYATNETNNVYKIKYNIVLNEINPTTKLYIYPTNFNTNNNQKLFIKVK